MFTTFRSISVRIWKWSVSSDCFEMWRFVKFNVRMKNKYHFLDVANFIQFEIRSRTHQIRPTTALLAEWPSAYLTLRRFLNFYSSVLPSFCSRFGEREERIARTLSAKNWKQESVRVDKTSFVRNPPSSRRCLSSLKERATVEIAATSNPYNAILFSFFSLARRKFNEETSTRDFNAQPSEE